MQRQRAGTWRRLLPRLFLLCVLLVAPSVGAEEAGAQRQAQLDGFRSTVEDAVADYAAAYANFTQAEDATTRDAARAAIIDAGHRVGKAFLSFEQGHGENASLSVFMQTEMGAGFYRGFEQDVVLLRASMLDAREGTPAPPSKIETKASPVLSSLDRTEECLPEGCGSLFSGAGVQSFLVLLREGFEAILLVGAITAFLHKSDRSDKVPHVYTGVGAALVTTLLVWWGLDTVFETAAQQGSIAHAVVEGATMLLAALVLFYVGFWLLSKVETDRWQAFIDGALESSLADDRSWMLGMVGFLAVFREGVETVLFVQAISIGSGGAWGPILAGLGVGALALAGLYLAVHRTGLKIPLRAFFGVTSAILLALSVRFMGLGIFEFQEAGLLGVGALEGVASWLAGSPLARVLLQDVFGFAPTLEVALGQGLLVGVVLAGVVWTFLVRPSLDAEPVRA